MAPIVSFVLDEAVGSENSGDRFTPVPTRESVESISQLVL